MTRLADLPPFGPAGIRPAATLHSNAGARAPAGRRPL